MLMLKFIITLKTCVYVTSFLILVLKARGAANV